jgi:hypothetical protein
MQETSIAWTTTKMFSSHLSADRHHSEQLLRPTLPPIRFLASSGRLVDGPRRRNTPGIKFDFAERALVIGNVLLQDCR